MTEGEGRAYFKSLIRMNEQENTEPGPFEFSSVKDEFPLFCAAAGHMLQYYHTHVWPGAQKLGWKKT